MARLAFDPDHSFPSREPFVESNESANESANEEAALKSSSRRPARYHGEGAKRRNVIRRPARPLAVILRGGTLAALPPKVPSPEISISRNAWEKEADGNHFTK